MTAIDMSGAYSVPSALEILVRLCEDAPTPVRAAAEDYVRIVGEGDAVAGELVEREAGLRAAEAEFTAETVARIAAGQTPNGTSRADVIRSDCDRLARTREAYEIAADEAEARLLYAARSTGVMLEWTSGLAAERADVRAELAATVAAAAADVETAHARIDELDGLAALLAQVASAHEPTERVYLRAAGRKPLLSYAAAAVPTGEFGQVRLDLSRIFAAAASYPDRPELHFASDAYEYTRRGPGDYVTGPAYNADDDSTYDLSAVLAMAEGRELDED